MGSWYTTFLCLKLGIKYSLTINFGYKPYRGFLNFGILHHFQYSFWYIARQLFRGFLQRSSARARARVDGAPQLSKSQRGAQRQVGYNCLISNKREWNKGFIKFFKLQTSGYYNGILVNFILNITKRPDINVTSGKPRENHMTSAPFAILVE